MCPIEHQIETARGRMEARAAQYGYKMTHPEVLLLSHNLDKLFNTRYALKEVKSM